MGDMKDYWQDMAPIVKERNKKKRERYVETSGKNGNTSVAALGLPYEKFEHNKQFAIRAENEIVDYWATTGTWIARKSRERGKGLHSLREYLGIDQ